MSPTYIIQMFFSYGSLNICTAGDADPSEEEDLAMELESPVNNDVTRKVKKLRYRSAS